MKKLRKSFRHATNGLKETLIHERNFKIMMVVAFVVAGAMFYLPTSRSDKALLTATIFAILILEMINVVIERLLDFLHPAHHEDIRVIKDFMAAIVFVASFGAAVVGLTIFWPYIFIF